MKKTLIIFIAITALASCSQSLLLTMGRVFKDPQVALPKVVSMAEENKIFISWDADPAAEEYLLERAIDAAAPIFSQLYRGSENSFTDEGVPDERRYLYRLTKIRGNRAFGPSEPVMGVGGNTREDLQEPNDTLETAKELTYDLASNIYYYFGHNNRKVEDLDWFYVSVPPQRQANIVVSESGLGIGANSSFNIYVEGNPEERIISGTSIPVKNESNQTVKIKFRISPIPQQFYDTLVGNGGRLVVYTLSLRSITTP